MLRRSTRRDLRQERGQRQVPTCQIHRTGQRDDRRADRLYDARHVSEAFTQAGFTLESTSNSDGWTPLNKVKEIIRLDLCICTDEVQCKLRSTMRYGKHSDGTAVIVKLLRSRCNEPSILEYLSSIDSPITPYVIDVRDMLLYVFKGPRFTLNDKCQIVHLEDSGEKLLPLLQIEDFLGVMDLK
jgi:hypothetical protein